MPGVVFVIGFALLAFAYDLCAQGCALPFRSPPRAAHRVRPRSPLEGCLGIESIGGYISLPFFFATILPQRYRVPARTWENFCAIGSGSAAARAHSLVPDYLGYVIISSWEVLFLYAIGSDCQHRPCARITLFFLYAIGSGFAFARARENTMGSVCLATARA
ncbi:hypothetical protein EDB85DRAFT_1460258 [Lactarius pseudohatsudake]|nr:hypothetical protein EDB85DRAFT_1460258 [Lactarius pseudohatsudake]